MSRPIIKKGVIVEGLKIPMKKAWYLYAGLCNKYGITPVITDAVAERSKTSLHPDGFAIDVRTRELINDEMRANFLKDLRRLLGDDYDVVAYQTHIHIEYQRFLDDQRKWNIRSTVEVA